MPRAKEPVLKPISDSSLAEVIGLVARRDPVIHPKTHRPTGQYIERRLTEAEVLSFKVYPHKIVVVTIDGQKFEADR